MIRIKATLPTNIVVYYHKPASLADVQFIPNPQAGKLFEGLEQAQQAWGQFRGREPYCQWRVEYEVLTD